MMRKIIENIFSFTLDFFRLFTLLFPSIGTYEHRVLVTFGDTNRYGVVGHSKYANIFGKARELFGISRIPGFRRDIGKKYLLKTVDAHYQHYEDFVFGDIIEAKVNVTRVNGASFCLQCLYFNQATKKIHAIVQQTIAYTDTTGRPRRMPYIFKKIIKSVEIKPFLNFNDCVAISKKTIDVQFEREQIVTTPMTNAEQNVNHDEYARMIGQALDLYFIKIGEKITNESRLNVENAIYRYRRDYFYGDKIVIRLSVDKIDGDQYIVKTQFVKPETETVHFSGIQIRRKKTYGL